MRFQPRSGGEMWGKNAGKRWRNASLCGITCRSPSVAPRLLACFVPGSVRGIKTWRVLRGTPSSGSTTVAAPSSSQVSRTSLFLQRPHDGCRWNGSRWPHSQLRALIGPEEEVVQQQAPDHSPCLAGAPVSQWYQVASIELYCERVLSVSSRHPAMDSTVV